jgi:PPP family 3-phenylpropionic acid transporter
VGIVAVPIWSLIADGTRHHARVLAIVLLGAAMLALAMGAAPSPAWILPIALLQAFLSTPIQPLLDNGAIATLHGETSGYGRLRVWGTVGWGVTATAVGWLTGRYGLHLIFVVYAVLMTSTLAFAVRLPADRRVADSHFLSEVGRLVRDRRLWRFLLTALAGGIGVGVANGWFLVYLSSLHATKGQLGLSILIQTISEVPFMFLGARLLQLVPARYLFVGALMLYGGRALCYALIHTPSILLGVQLLHGPTFATMWIAGVAVARQLAPRGLGATLQGLLWSALSGLGASVGTVLGGQLFDAAGPEATFLVSATILAVGVPAIALSGSLLGRRRLLGT